MKLQSQTAVDLSGHNWSDALAGAISERAAISKRVLLCVTGKTGVGKTTFARQLRKKGIPGFKRSEITVIDDGVMTAPRFGVINRRIRFRCESRDELAPFEPYLRGKKVVIYVAIQPEKRISRCDILLRLLCSDNTRKARLVAHRTNGIVRYEKSLHSRESADIPADRYFSLTTE
ncbi:MAG: hypothetical protein ACO3G9_01225 [Chthoniobacterales bacterium]